MATYKNLYIDQGSNFSFTLEQSVDLEDYTYAGKISKSYESTTFTDLSLASNDDNDALKISLTAAQTAALKPGRYVYDVIIKKTADSTITRVIEGQVHINPGVTFDASAPESDSDADSDVSVFRITNAEGAVRDAYAFVELDQNLRYDAGTNSSITLNVNLAETVGAQVGNIGLFLTTQTFVNDVDRNFDGNVDGFHSLEYLSEGPNTITLSVNSANADEGTVKYLAILYDDLTTNILDSSQESEFELSDLEITSSTHPDGLSIGFKTPKQVVNSNVNDTDTTHKFNSISSSTGLFKSE